MVIPGILLLDSGGFRPHTTTKSTLQSSSRASPHPGQAPHHRGYEISNPDGPGIQFRCRLRGDPQQTSSTTAARRSRTATTAREGNGRCPQGDADKPFETGAILVFDAKGAVEIFRQRDPQQ